MKKTLFILTVLALGFTACNKEIEQPKEENQEVDVYNVCIPASMGADTKAVDFSGTDPVTGKPTAVSSFTTSDIIYVYNQTKGAMLTGHLSPSAAGKTCDLTGTLTGTIEKDDNLVLLYKLNFFNSERNVYCYDYSEQNGTQAGVLDGATATVTASVDDDNLTAASASFTNVQSMFRFQFASGGTPVNVKSVLITSKNNALSIVYYPLIVADPYLLSFSVPVSLPSATTDPIYVALCMDESISAGDELTFGVVDADNKYYTKTKAAPSGGFKNGRYYYNSSAIDLDYVAQLVKPAGALSGMFTVNGSGKQVFFSQGNLVYNGGGTWSFHENQYDWFSGSSTATGYPMDLFTWGNISSPAYNGDSYDTGTAALSGSRDWGSNMADGWRTLTKAEWTYVFSSRTTTSGVRFARAKVNDVKGMILLPDDWSTDYYTLNNTNDKTSAFTSNEMDSDTWTNSLEAHGAVFLPAAGLRDRDQLTIDVPQGCYWSSTPYDTGTDNAYYLYFFDGGVRYAEHNFRQVGRSVRLVYDVE